MGCAPSVNSADDADKPKRADGGDVVDLMKEKLDDFERECLGIKRVTQKGEVVGATDRNEGRPDENANFAEADVPGETRFMATKPWAGAVVAPTNPPDNDPSPPTATLSLEFVHGIRIEDARHHLCYSSNPDEIIFMAAAVGVVMNKKTRQQRFFGAGSTTNTVGHTDDIRALAVTRDGKKVVTGEVGSQPKLFVWDPNTCKQITSFKGKKGMRGAVQVAFSATAKYVGVVYDNDDHTFEMFDAQGQSVHSGKVGPDPITCLEFSKTDDDVCGLAGKRGVHFFNLDTKEFKKGIFKGAEQSDMATVIWAPNGDCLSGGANGSFYVWKNREVALCKPAHHGCIHALHIASVGGATQFYTSGADGKICVHDEAYNQLQTITLKHFAKSIDVDPASGSLLVACRDASILELSSDGSNTTTILEGHSTGEVWGLDVCQKTGNVVTCGEDNLIKVWDPKSKKCVASAVINEKAGPRKKIGGASTMSLNPPNQCGRAVAVNSTNGHVAVGVNNGEFQVRKGTNQLTEMVALKHDTKEWIEVIKFSPSGDLCAVGSHDNNIYLYDTDNYNIRHILKGHNSFITALDFSMDGKYIHSVCGAYELLFFNTETGKQETGGATMLRDEQWKTWSVKFGWPVQGVYGKVAQGTHIYHVQRSPDQKYFVSSDDFGLVNLYRNPILEGNKGSSFRAHSSYVTRAKFSKDGKEIYSIGGFDKTLMQWKLNE